MGGLCSNHGKQVQVLQPAQTVEQLYDAGRAPTAIAVFATASTTSDTYKQAMRCLCLHAGPALRPEYATHFARSGAMHLTEYEVLDFSADGLGKVPKMLFRLSVTDRSEVLCDYGRALYSNGRRSLFDVAKAVLHHRATTPVQHCVQIIIDASRDALQTSSDPETALLDGVASAIRAGDIEIASLLLAHIECYDANDSRRRRMFAHLLQAYLTTSKESWPLKNWSTLN